MRRVAVSQRKRPRTRSLEQDRGYGVTIFGDNPKASKILSVVHNHYDVGTGDLPECAFYSDHLASVGLSEHKHRHHSGICSI